MGLPLALGAVQLRMTERSSTVTSRASGAPGRKVGVSHWKLVLGLVKLGVDAVT